MIAVVDASVALKWFFNDRDDEPHTDRAAAILREIGAGQVRMIQPPHFLAEVAAVLARKEPANARSNLTDLQLLDWESVESPAIYATAVALSIDLQHHLFDTLYMVQRSSPTTIPITTKPGIAAGSPGCGTCERRPGR